MQEATGQVLGVHDCSLTVAEGEILVLMGLSGSGKSTLLRAVNGLNPVVRRRRHIYEDVCEGQRARHFLASAPEGQSATRVS